MTKHYSVIKLETRFPEDSPNHLVLIAAQWF